MRRGFAVVGLCLLLVLSGCSFLPGGAESEDEPPGIEDGELTDSEALLEAHEAALTESGYSHDLTVNQTGVVDNRTRETTRRQRMSVGPGADQYLRQVIYSGQMRVIAWGNDSVEYLRIERGGDVQYSSSSPESPTAMSGVNVFESHLSAPLEVTATGTREGRTLRTLEATGRPSEEGAFPENVTSVDRYDLTVVVDGEGRILRFEAIAEYSVDGTPGSYDLTYEVTSVSDPGVERPSWVESIEG